MNKKIMTLCMVYDDKRILLGQIKKDGVLKGRFNGFGGKVEEGETIENATKRELFEEAKIKPLNIKKRGVLVFNSEPDGNAFEGKPQVEMHIYSAIEFEGNPTETTEMKPEWFLHNEIPFDSMWPDDMLWMPLLLAGKNFRGTFHLKDPNTIMDYELIEVTTI
jgi:8-oxo-dGTP pyrophosphatase MutT (NUDIX family)